MLVGLRKAWSQSILQLQEQSNAYSAEGPAADLCVVKELLTPAEITPGKKLLRRVGAMLARM